MAKAQPPRQVRTLGDVRSELSHLLRQFASMGVDAPDIFFGRHRKPEAVVISYDRWRQLNGLKPGEQPRASTRPPRSPTTSSAANKLPGSTRRKASDLPGKGIEDLPPDLLQPLDDLDEADEELDGTSPQRASSWNWRER